MTRMDRSIRTFAVAIASALLVACGSDEATAPRQDPTPPPGGEQPPPVPAPTPVGRWASQRIDGNALPARIAGGTEENGLTWEVRVLHDSLTVTADGRWVQRVRTRQTQSDGFDFSGTWADRGTWTREGSTIHFESDWIQNVRFDAQLTTEGRLLVQHDFTLDDEIPSMLREMQR